MRHAFAVLGALAILAAPAAAQVTQVPNTGCPGATYARYTGSPRIGQQMTFGWQCSAANKIVLAFLGLPTLGAGIALGQPVTCEVGPCMWYPGPIGSTIVQFPGEVVFPLSIPSDPQLVGFELALQCACWCG